MMSDGLIIDYPVELSANPQYLVTETDTIDRFHVNGVRELSLSINPGIILINSRCDFDGYAKEHMWLVWRYSPLFYHSLIMSC
jgi:hypothetical protein